MDFIIFNKYANFLCTIPQTLLFIPRWPITLLINKWKFLSCLTKITMNLIPQDLQLLKLTLTSIMRFYYTTLKNYSKEFPLHQGRHITTMHFHSIIILVISTHPLTIVESNYIQSSHTSFAISYLNNFRNITISNSLGCS